MASMVDAYHRGHATQLAIRREEVEITRSSPAMQQQHHRCIGVSVGAVANEEFTTTRNGYQPTRQEFGWIDLETCAHDLGILLSCSLSCTALVR